MSTMDVRNNSAMMKRAEQLKRWEESDTNRAAATPRHETGRRIKFSSGCVFLAACLSSDKAEVLQLLDQGADINTANVDGLTALHQACIDDNLEMVEFLILHGADINRQDNEGWTPLHATASCGFVSIARYLVENGADVAAVNSDGDLAVDLAIDVEHRPMIDYMQKVVRELNIDVEQARKAEEQAMLNDAKKWLRSDASEMDRPHPKTGATALHVAAAKGYTNVLSLLLAGRGNVDRQDNDGWTALHAAAHWGQKETAEMLIESQADMDIRNYAGQSCIDVADRKMVKFLEELRANKRNKRRPSSQISRISDTFENHVDKTPTKLVRVEVRTDATKDADNLKTNSNQQIHATEHPVEEEAPWRRKTPRTPNDSPTKNQVPDKELTGKSSESNDVILRRTQSFENDQKKPIATFGNATPTTPTTTATTLSSPSTAVHTPPVRSNTITTNTAPNNNGNSGNSASASDTELPKPKQSTGNIFKNFFKSFVPPVRDEESETQRKAHAKRVRETRRSTQGVTLDEIKSAEELVKKKNLGMNNNNNNNNNNSSGNETQATSSTSTTTTTTTSPTSTTTSNIINTQEPQPPPPPTTPPPAIIPTSSDETEIEAVSAISESADTTASFTIAAPARRQHDGDGDGVPHVVEPIIARENDDADREDDSETSNVVSASYTIVSRREKPAQETSSSSSNNNKLKTDEVAKNTEPETHAFALHLRPTELPLGTDATKTVTTTTPVGPTTPTALESPVRLRDKRSMSSAGNDADNRSDTGSLVSPMAGHSDFNARDSLLSYARRTEGSGGEGAGATIAPATTTAPAAATTTATAASSTSTAERRPSWRIKFDAGSKFKLEDNYPPNNSTIIPSAPAVIAAATTGSQRRISSGSNALNASNQSLNSVGRPVSAPSVGSQNENTNNSAFVLPPARKYDSSTTTATANTANSTATANTANSTAASAAASTVVGGPAATNASPDDKDNDKENDNRTQTAIQRRRKPKRRSTGVVHVDMDEIDPERQNESSNNDNEEKESGSERTSRSRLGSTTSTATTSASSESKTTSSDKTENGDGIDYKALWEAAKLENDKLKQMLKQKDDEVVQTRATLERFANATTKNSLSEIEKRERRAMERKLSELEEELKLLQKLKTENDRLRAENRALTRVVSKLTTSAQSQLAKTK
ncbi:protein phosphatase 1 regulatory subunit 12C isoform X7 [Scaptodrosophila lebanonensis]|uniref:Protein phosphatase 1 regulatory subunit 12B n=1 Tax=Drosophila lebanonensis TaxID=7225 RepID=A0A6J2TAP7_DROLE|nr:protein phosphatase 1 regulatory subunit 12C isoform X7 [Scaptodrosophila lebanonensis]